MQIFDAPRGRGLYGITVTPDGTVYYASLAGSYIGRIDPETGEAAELEPPTSNQGARRVWSDSQGRVWVSDFGVNSLVRFDPTSETFTTFELPSPDAAVRQIPGRPGEIWGAESAVDKIIVIRTGS